LPLDQPAASRKPRSSGARGVPVVGNATRCRGTAGRSGAAARHGLCAGESQGGPRPAAWRRARADGVGGRQTGAEGRQRRHRWRERG
jgi:hypothetical protein